MNEHEDTPPRKRDVGQGFPEEAPPGTGIDAHEHPEDEVTADHDAPETSPEQDSDPSHATGNPNAAGG